MIAFETVQFEKGRGGRKSVYLTQVFRELFCNSVTREKKGKVQALPTAVVLGQKRWDGAQLKNGRLHSETRRGGKGDAPGSGTTLGGKTNEAPVSPFTEYIGKAFISDVKNDLSRKAEGNESPAGEVDP